MNRIGTTRKGVIGVGLCAALLVLALDQASKYWVREVLHLEDIGSIDVLPVLSLTFRWNQGVTFGLLNSIGGSSRFVLSAVALVIVVALGAWLWRADRKLVAGSIGAIAGGAVGNVIDRLRFGAVVDFVHAHAWGWSWYIFNIADAAIVCGVAALVIDGLLPRPERPHLADAVDRS